MIQPPAGKSTELPKLCEAFLRDESRRAHALLDAGIDPRSGAFQTGAHRWLDWKERLPGNRWKTPFA